MAATNCSLKPYNTFGIDVQAKAFDRFSNLEELSACINTYKGLELLIVGGGSNILFTKDFDGVVLKKAIPSWNMRIRSQWYW